MVLSWFRHGSFFKNSTANQLVIIILIILNICDSCYLNYETSEQHTKVHALEREIDTGRRDCLRKKRALNKDELTDALDQIDAEELVSDDSVVSQIIFWLPGVVLFGFCSSFVDGFILNFFGSLWSVEWIKQLMNVSSKTHSFINFCYDSYNVINWFRIRSVKTLTTVSKNW